MLEPAKIAIADIETPLITYSKGGVIQYPTRVHVLCARDRERGQTHLFVGDHVEEGVRWLETCDSVVFHNGVGFDVPVLRQNFGLTPRDDKQFVDSMVLTHLFYSNVKEEEDFARYAQHVKNPPAEAFRFTGDLVGSHSLLAWGLRLENPQRKMDYEAACKAAGIDDPWGEYNEIMEEYVIQDVVTLEAIWNERLDKRWRDKANADAIAVEHYLAELMGDVKKTGIKLNKKWAEELADSLEKRQEELNVEIQEEFPPRLEPTKWVHRAIPLDQPDLTDEERLEAKSIENSDKPEDIARYTEIMTTNGPPQRLTPLMFEHQKNRTYRPRFNLPEGYLREEWGEVFTPKVSRVARDKQGNELYHAVKDCPFVKVAPAALNPNSRPQIIRRLLELGWVPEEFTDAGNPVTSEVELTKLEEEFPAAKNLAKYLLIQKRLGQIRTGEKAWLNLVDDDDFIHPSIWACNTVAFRASHSDPNISQVPSVRMTDLLDADGNKVKNEKGKVKQVPLQGEAGKWGWDCRACFTVPDGWRMVGIDLAGIEMRAWAHYLWKYDDGYFADIVLNKDVHEENRVILGFADRRKAKEFLYALMYGGGDEKLGFIIDPLASPAKQKMLGQAARARFMHGLRGYRQLNDELMLGVRRGYLKGLDERRSPVRKPHAALNTLLQGAGAIISKYWIVYAMGIIENEYGLKWGYDQDFTLLIYSHDELDFACLPEHSHKIEDACVRGAEMAGKRLGFRLPVEVGVMHGVNWAECH